MEMKKLVDGITSLQKLANTDMPINLTLQVQRNVNNVNEALNIFNGKIEKLRQEAGVKKEEALPEKYHTQVQAYLDESIDIKIEPIMLANLEAAEIRVSVTDLNNLEWMLK